MFFKEEFFKNEVREGFFVSSMMKRAWAAQIEVLEDFDKFCREHNLRYFAAYGTLLGAVRHNGFIPWDDDIDLWMMRKDFEKLRSLSEDNQLPGSYLLKNAYNTPDYDEPFDRIVNAFSIDFDDKRLNKYHGFPFAAGLDIFPLDFVPTGKNLERFKEDVGILSDIFSILRTDEKAELNNRMLELLGMKFKCKIDRDKNITNQITQLFDKAIINCSKHEERYVTLAHSWAMRDFKEHEMPYEMFKNIEYLQFENFSIPVPADYEEVLSNQYGNYKIIKMDIKGAHDYPFYNKQDDYLFKSINKRLLNKEIDKEKILEYHSNEINIDVKGLINDRVSVLGRINDCIIELVEIGNFEKVFEFIENSQDIAIKIGNEIEKRYDDSTNKEIISKLEEYCENLYNMTNELSNGSDKFVDYFQENLNLYDEIKRQIEEIKSEPNKVVVFIFQNSKEWEKYEKLYNELNSNENIRCYAVPIPYYIRKTDFMIDEENLYFDGDEIQTDVALEDYESFDFENIDCIIKSSPYDDSYGDVNIPFFHSENLHNCCKTIIHVPTLDIIDFTEESGKMMEMAKCFVKTKSVMYSDYVILNSKVNRETYIQILSEACDSVEWSKKVLYCTDDEMAEVIIQKCMK